MLFFAAVLISVISLVDVVRSTNLVTANPAERGIPNHPFRISGPWGDYTNCGGVRYVNNTIGATASFTFAGTDIAIFGMLWGDGGRADVFIDNELVGAAGINCYGADETCNSQLFYKSGLDGYSTHTIVVKTLDTRWIYLQQIRYTAYTQQEIYAHASTSRASIASVASTSAVAVTSVMSVSSVSTQSTASVAFASIAAAKKSKNVMIGGIVGGVVGGLLAIGAVIGLIFCLKRRKRVEDPHDGLAPQFTGTTWVGGAPYEAPKPENTKPSDFAHAPPPLAYGGGEFQPYAMSYASGSYSDVRTNSPMSDIAPNRHDSIGNRMSSGLATNLQRDNTLARPAPAYT